VPVVAVVLSKLKLPVPTMRSGVVQVSVPPMSGAAGGNCAGVLTVVAARGV
jgi:hypothetical protein